jgi:hypothetical protein
MGIKPRTFDRLSEYSTTDIHPQSANTHDLNTKLQKPYCCSCFYKVKNFITYLNIKLCIWPWSQSVVIIEITAWIWQFMIRLPLSSVMSVNEDNSYWAFGSFVFLPVTCKSFNILKCLITSLSIKKINLKHNLYIQYVIEY